MIAARRPLKAAQAAPPRPEPPTEPCLAVRLLHEWEAAVALGDGEAADMAIALLKNLAQRPDRDDD